MTEIEFPTLAEVREWFAVRPADEIVGKPADHYACPLHTVFVDAFPEAALIRVGRSFVRFDLDGPFVDGPPWQPEFVNRVDLVKSEEFGALYRTKPVTAAECVTICDELLAGGY